MKNVLLWFGLHDLRLHDHYALKLAIRRAKSTGGCVYPFFCFDLRKYAAASEICEFFVAHPRRAIFVKECIQDLRQSLDKLNQRIWIRSGHVENILPDLAVKLNCTEVFSHELYSPEDIAIRQRLEQRLHAADEAIRLNIVWGSTLLHIDDLDMPVSEFPIEFNRYLDFFHRKNVRKTDAFDCRSPNALPPQEHREDMPSVGSIPTLEDLGYRDQQVTYDSRGVLDFFGGETEGCERVQFFFEKKLIENYNPAFAERERARLYKQRASNLSPWITHGCVSPRRLYELVFKYSHDQRGTKDWECKSFIMLLVRRDYWHFLSKRFGPRMRTLEGPTPKSCSIDPPKDGWRMDPLLISRFCSGLTGFPFVDAAMRELTMTGFSSVQCRRALLWFLVRGLQQDWRIAAEWFQRCLIDYDPHICWGNCVYYSGLMFDIGTRLPLHDAEHHHLQFDGSGVFTRLWLPELQNVPSYFLHRPQAMTKHMQEIHSARIGIDYPVPIKLWFDAEKDLNFVSKLPNYINEHNATLIGEGTKFGLGIFSDIDKKLQLCD